MSVDGCLKYNQLLQSRHNGRDKTGKVRHEVSAGLEGGYFSIVHLVYRMTFLPF